MGDGTMVRGEPAITDQIFKDFFAMPTFDLLVIDPQNDFLDIDGAALPVPGANADMNRLALWLSLHARAVQSITLTMDSHPSVAVERTSFWRAEDGTEVPPFTVVTAADVRSRRFLPRHHQRTAQTLAYLDALESAGQRQLVVWPVHCVLGTWGHNLHAGLHTAIAQWEADTDCTCEKVLKGFHPMTEQYSAFRAEVPREDDPRTGLNRELLRRLGQGADRLLIAGEASSHCVAASVDDLLQNLPQKRLERTVLLTDCMSPVTGFEAAAQGMVDRARAKGVAAFALDAVV
jgi:nicotinamidase-related amidase